jgi:hypothetical protein
MNECCAYGASSIAYSGQHAVQFSRGGRLEYLFDSDAMRMASVGLAWATYYGNVYGAGWMDVDMFLLNATSGERVHDCTPFCARVFADYVTVWATPSRAHVATGPGASKDEAFNSIEFYPTPYGIEVVYTSNVSYGVQIAELARPDLFSDSFALMRSFALVSERQGWTAALGVTMTLSGECSTTSSLGIAIVADAYLLKSCTIPKCVSCVSYAVCGECEAGYSLADDGSWCQRSECQSNDTAVRARVSYVDCMKCEVITKEATCDYSADCSWCANEGNCKYDGDVCHATCSEISDQTSCVASTRCAWQMFLDYGGYSECVAIEDFVDCSAIGSNETECSATVPCSFCAYPNAMDCRQTSYDCTACARFSDAAECAERGAGSCSWCDVYQECNSIEFGSTLQCPGCENYRNEFQCTLGSNVGCTWCESSSSCISIAESSAEKIGNCSCSTSPRDRCATGTECAWCSAFDSCASKGDCVPCAAERSEPACSAQRGCVYQRTTCLTAETACSASFTREECESVPKGACAWCSSAAECRSSSLLANGTEEAAACAAAPPRQRAADHTVAVAVGVSLGCAAVVAAAVAGVAVAAASRRRRRMLRGKETDYADEEAAEESALQRAIELSVVAAGSTVSAISPESAPGALGVQVSPHRVDFSAEAAGGILDVDSQTATKVAISNCSALVGRGHAFSVRVSARMFVDASQAMYVDAAVIGPREMLPGDGSSGRPTPNEATELAPGESVGASLFVKPMCTMRSKLALLVYVWREVGGGGGGNGAVAAAASSPSPLRRSGNREQWELAGCVSVPVDVASKPSGKLHPKSLKKAEVLGQGAFGIVFRGKYDGAEVAIKQMPIGQGNDVFDNEVQREMSALTRLRCPYVVTYYGAAFEPGQMNIVLELAPMGGLGSYLAKHQTDAPFTPRLEALIALDCARGLQALHAQRFIHRDVKPDNLLVFSLTETAPVRVKITDLGSSRELGVCRTENNYTKGVGTPVYMAPEVLSGSRINPSVVYGPKADVYSFAVTLWSLAMRKVPFDDCAATCSVATKICNGERPGGLAPGHHLAQMIEDCWKQDPAARPDMIVAVARLEELAESLKK